MKRIAPPLYVVATILLLTLPPLAMGAELQRLWSIGHNDNDYAEFKLAPGHFGQFGDDGFFVIGQSETKTDWPYVQPGPADAWAGGKSHTFTIMFGLDAIPQKGDCQLVLDLIDTQSVVPPKLRIDINGRAFDHATPRGAGDASIRSDVKNGHEHKITLKVPTNVLRRGNNLISITTLSGSWLLYDWIGLDTPSGARLGMPQGTMVRAIRTAPLLIERDDHLLQTVSVDILHLGDKGKATVTVAGAAPVEVTLESGRSTVDIPVPAVEEATELSVRVSAGDAMIATESITIQPVRHWVVYMLPHSHVDIGYTHVQTEVEQSHWKYYEQAIQASRETAKYPAGAQFKWNVEVLWATDSYLKQASPEKRAEFIEAVKKGWIGLDALYGNELTALCRPEELVQLVEFGNRLKRQYDVPIDSAMISDVPGYTWGIVSVLAESGVKYFSIGPNGGHRIGYTLSEYGDKPFWWRSPCGQHRVLCWIPRTGYWRGFRGEAGLMSLLKQMGESDYPYDLVQIRHCLGDNAGPGTDLSQFVKEWNSKYAYPRLIIATTSEMMHELERRYGDQIPELSGDFTPYWEDGAGSSARETALNRAAAERLVQAETLYALLQPKTYQDSLFQRAWRNVVLYDEHTWGAHCSISQPESEFTKSQWAIKQKFALDADSQSRQLIRDSISGRRSTAQLVSTVDVFNTTSWPRTDLITLPADMKLIGDRVKDDRGFDIPTQRLASGELALLAMDVPALGARRLIFHPGNAVAGVAAIGAAKVDGNTIANSRVAVSIDKQTGAIANLTWNDHNFALVGDSAAPKINDYFYVAGRKPDNPQRGGQPAIAIEDNGPLVATVAISSTAPGCNALQRRVRVIAGLNRVDLTNTVDKKNVYEPEAVHFAFPFNVPDGTIRIDIPWAVARVESDQLPGACKNYFTAQRWADVANEKRGITLATIDAPLLEVGQITCDPTAVGWIKQLEPSQTLYSYVMNNYWETNYKAGQEGPTTFRYSLQPHGKYDQERVQRFGIERSQPLLAVPVDPKSQRLLAPLKVDGDGVIVTSIKPAEEPDAIVIRLFNSVARQTEARLIWQTPLAQEPQLCDLVGRPIGSAPKTLKMAPYQIVTLRVTLRTQQ